jgi:hypothetical protein
MEKWRLKQNGCFVSKKHNRGDSKRGIIFQLEGYTIAEHGNRGYNIKRDCISYKTTRFYQSKEDSGLITKKGYDP